MTLIDERITSILSAQRAELRFSLQLQVAQKRLAGHVGKKILA